jgi:hypothetical protein
MLLKISKKQSFVFNKIWLFYFLIKIFYLVFAVVVYTKFTTLGDTFRYLRGPLAWESSWFYSSTIMMDSFASTFAKLFGTYLGNFPFLVISFVGVYYPVSKINLTTKQLLGVLALLSLPSFGVWTSIASKESVSVFFMGMMLAAYVDIYEHRPIQNKFLFFLSVYLCLVFKPQYIIGVFAIFSFTYLSRKCALNAFVKIFLFIAMVFVGSSVLYYFRDIIDELSKMMPAHFSLEAGSTRENTIWVEQYDFFKNAAYGMYIAFVGPTVQEALTKSTHMMAWVESIIILGVFGVLTLKYVLTAVLRSRVNVMFLCGFTLVTFWILLVHYPFGALNPGSAIRYRESFYAFLVCLFFFMYKNAMVSFLQTNRDGNR